jgi:Ser/Thr protein kinase RdoA (MazF antagonist)
MCVAAGNGDQSCHGEMSMLPKMRDSAPMAATDDPHEPPTSLLSEDAGASIERMLQDSGGTQDHVLTVESLWERRNVLRVHTNSGSVVVKLARDLESGDKDHGTLQSEAAALALFTSMPMAVAPRLIGFDSALSLVVMEDLPPGRTLAELLLLGDPRSVEDALTLIARALAALHAYTGPREGEYVASTEELNAPKLRRAWLRRAHEERGAFLNAVGTFVPTDGLDEEVTMALERLETSHYRGLVHGDLCPDNVRMTDAGVRIFDFEASTFGPIALDVAYFLAPFPSCWCFAELPDEIATHALSSYLDELTQRGVLVGDDFRIDIAAALACYLVAWLGQVSEVLTDDEQWGTTTVRPRFLRWLTSFERYEASAAAFPRLSATVRDLLAVLHDRWPDTASPRFPAFAPTGSAVQIPSFWQPGL